MPSSLVLNYYYYYYSYYYALQFVTLNGISYESQVSQVIDLYVLCIMATSNAVDRRDNDPHSITIQAIIYYELK